MAKVTDKDLQRITEKLGGNFIVERIEPDDAPLMADAGEVVGVVSRSGATRAGRDRSVATMATVSRAVAAPRKFSGDFAVRVRPKSGKGPPRIQIYSSKTKELLLEQG